MIEIGAPGGQVERDEGEQARNRREKQAGQASFAKFAGWWSLSSWAVHEFGAHSFWSICQG